jgi:hypothetical protein
MYEKRFSCGARWIERESLLRNDCPGVYAIAYSRQDLVGTRFAWEPHIIYLGMTNNGLRPRLYKFDKTIAGGRGHGGADRVRYKYANYRVLAQYLYVAVARFPCDIRSGLRVT